VEGIVAGKDGLGLVAIAVGHDVVHAAGKRLDGTEMIASAFLVDGLSFDTILLIWDFEGGIAGGAQHLERGGVGDVMPLVVSEVMSLQDRGIVLVRVERGLVYSPTRRR